MDRNGDNYTSLIMLTTCALSFVPVASRGKGEQEPAGERGEGEGDDDKGERTEEGRASGKRATHIATTSSLISGQN